MGFRSPRTDRLFANERTDSASGSRLSERTLIVLIFTIMLTHLFCHSFLWSTHPENALAVICPRTPDETLSKRVFRECNHAVYAVLSGGMTALLLTPGTGICRPAPMSGAYRQTVAAGDESAHANPPVSPLTLRYGICVYRNESSVLRFPLRVPARAFDAIALTALSAPQAVMASGVLLNLHMIFGFQGTQPASTTRKSFFLWKNFS